MEKRQILFKRVSIVILIVCVVIATVICGWNINVSTAYAESDDVQTRYEETNVLNNLNGSTIGGKPFDLADYPHDSNGKPTIISFVEFCYSYYAEKQNDYGLYVYVYNPQDIAIDTETNRNKIQLIYGSKASYSKYILDFLNYSTEPGYEGRFYKFKLRLSDADITDILTKLDPDNRTYKISGIELSVKKKVTEYTVASTYTYKGYALGYGSELAESDSLSCTVDGFDKYLTLDVRSTFWRPTGTHADLHSRDTLHSVYFSVPNEIVSEYGEMTGVHATWLNAQTTRMLVTGNRDVYNAIEPHLGEHIDCGSSEGANSKTINYAVVTDSEDSYYGHGYYGTLGYNVFTSDDSGVCTQCYDEVIYKLNYLFYAENGDADSYDLPAEQIIGDEKKGIKGWLQQYTEKHGGSLVNNRFSRELFNKVDSEFTEVNITADDTFKLSDVNTSTKWWLKLFGPSNGIVVDSTNEYDISAIQKVTQSDIDSNAKAAFCNKFYINDNDYDELKEYIKEATINQETVYLFRYMQTVYDSQEAREFTFEKDWAMARGDFWSYKELDTNAYIAQMWMQLDFDIIDLTFTKNGVITVIPVVMSPIDIAADADHPVYTTDDNALSWWQILLAILLGILVIILLLKFAPGVLTVIVKILVFVITLPFKLLGAMFKPIHNKAKAAREKRKIARTAKKEQQRIEREQRKAQERERKEAEKQKRRAEKIKRKEQERERKRDEKARERERKKQDRDFAKWRNKQERQARKNLKRNKKKKLTLADLDKMSDSQLAELYYEEYGFDDSDIPDEFWEGEEN